MSLVSRVKKRSTVTAAAALAISATLAGGGLLANAFASEFSAQVDLAPTPLVGHDPALRSEITTLFSGVSRRYAAQEELVRRCMEGKGFTYVKNPAPQSDVVPAVGQDNYGQSLQEASTTGYRSAEIVGDSPADIDRSGVQKLPQDQQQKWGDALLGPDSGPEVTVNIPMFGEVGTPTDGCLTEARRTLYGSIEQWLKLDFLSGNMLLQAQKSARADSEVSELNSAWSTCMAEKGHKGLGSPDSARAETRRIHATLGIGSSEARDREIGIATADAECDTKIAYGPKRRAIEDDYYRRTLVKYKTEIAALRSMNAKASIRADEILRGA
ncbi:hypothetical protein ACFV0L_14475 [Streptosporangium canum]|uniref:hypothetical protein n=1 Tax=Streptosporangium canum TaxID=324952 RepID=UPI0036B3B75B